MDDVEGILVLPSALKHEGITEAGIEHALGFSLRSFEDDQDGAVMTIGPNQVGICWRSGTGRSGVSSSWYSTRWWPGTSS